MLQNATPLQKGNQRPDLLTALMNMSLVPRLPLKMHLCRSSSNAPRLPSFLETLKNPHVLLTCDKVHNPLPCHAKRHLNARKWSEPVSWFTLLTSKCASRQNGVHFFDISTSKSGPDLLCFVHFDFEMCFAPQRRALFRHLNFQKWSGPGVPCLLEICFAPQRRALFQRLTSKSAPNLVCFVHFDFEICFAPQRRALFRHLKF